MWIYFGTNFLGRDIKHWGRFGYLNVTVEIEMTGFWPAPNFRIWKIVDPMRAMELLLGWRLINWMCLPRQDCCSLIQDLRLGFLASSRSSIKSGWRALSPEFAEAFPRGWQRQMLNKVSGYAAAAVAATASARQPFPFMLSRDTRLSGKCSGMWQGSRTSSEGKSVCECAWRHAQSRTPPPRSRKKEHFISPQRKGLIRPKCSASFPGREVPATSAERWAHLIQWLEGLPKISLSTYTQIFHTKGGAG